MKKQETFLGTISPEEFQSIILRLDTKKIFLVRGKSSYESCGAKQFIESSISLLKYEVYEHYDFSNNPKIKDIERGLEYLKHFDADLIIAIGGGSVLDTAKLIRFLYSYNGNITENNFTKQHELLPLVVLPTTAGSGSESTHFSVVYKDKIKYSVDHDDILPDISIVDPTFTYNNPKYLAACSGFDALSQAIESWWNINATEESDDYALKAINFLWKQLPSAVNHKIKLDMDAVVQGSYWAGKAINITKTTVPHAMSYAFTAFYNIPHGNAVALTFPFFAEYNIKVTADNYRGIAPLEQYQEKMDRLSQLLGITDPDSIILNIRQFIESLGLLSSLKFDKEIIFKNINASRMNNNPSKITPNNINMILDAIKK